MDTQTLYERKRTSVRDALRRIPRGGRIFLGSGCAEPTSLSQGLTQYAHFFADNSIIHILTQGEAAYTRPEYADNFRLNVFFIGPNVREAVQAGRADYTPIFLSEVPQLFASGQMLLDAALVQVSPPDEHGFCSLGIGVDIVRSAVQHARLVVAEVNHNVPRTHGDTRLHLDEIDALVESNTPLLEWHGPDPGEVANKIAAHVARLVDDGATLQIGIGSVPDAILRSLGDKNDLGIHTEMLSDGVLDLVRRGVVTGARKTLHPHAVVASFCMGSKDLYDWVDDNAEVLLYPSDYTNDPGVIRQNDNMVAINGAIAVDLTGQVCADSVGSRPYSGIGGQVDFMRGAAKSQGGRPIIAMPSTATSTRTGRRVSRIVAHLEEGAGVVTSRGDVHYVVTEYGVAYLHGKSIAERARALIEIAHPDFRDELLQVAKARHYAPQDLAPIPKTDPYPAQLEHERVFNHAQHGPVSICFRPIKAADERRLQDFFYSHTDQTVYDRYGYRAVSMPHQRALSMVQLDYHSRLAIVALVGKPGEEKIVAVGRYELDGLNLAEIALVVHEEYRGLGIASHLLEFLVQVARDKGFSGVCAQFISSNKTMVHMFNKVLGAADEMKTWCGETGLYYYFDGRKHDKDTSANRAVIIDEAFMPGVS